MSIVLGVIAVKKYAQRGLLQFNHLCLIGFFTGNDNEEYRRTISIMNIDHGAITLELLAKRGVIVVPQGFTTFTQSYPPDFSRLLELARNGIRVHIGLAQGWINASLYEILIRLLTGKTAAKAIFRERCFDLRDIEVFMQHTERELEAIFHDTILKAALAPNYIRGVAYQCYISAQVEYSYLAQVTGSAENPNYLIQVGIGNLTGWNFKCCQNIHGTEQDFLTDTYITEGQVLITREFIKLIKEQLRSVYNSVYTELKNVVLEGKIMNDTYPTPGPVVSDLYQGVGYPAELDHATFIETLIAENLEYLSENYGQTIF
jgi:hypothetical protein